jgi:hypothetical protein
MKEGLKKVFQIMIVFIATYLCSNFVMNLIKINYISQLDLNGYSVILSFLVSTVVTILVDLNVNLSYELRGRSSVLKVIIIILLLLAILFSIFVYQNTRQVAFCKWNEISLFQMLISLLLLMDVFYVPALILNIFLKFKFELSERIIFYPALSSIFFILLGIVASYFKTNVIVFLFLIFLNLLLLLLLLSGLKSTSDEQVRIHTNILEILGILSAILFHLFIFYSAIGESSAFLRGDMWGDTHRVAVLAKFGLNGYLESPVEGYPPFYAFLWLTISSILPLPLINSMIVVSFLNHIFSVISLYLFAKHLYKDYRSAVLTVILWTALSGFAWSYLIFKPPSGVLSGKQVLDYIDQISVQFGKYSGTIVSPIYADGHALTRLWSLYLLFVVFSVLLKMSNLAEQNRGYELMIFLSGYVQLLLGHGTEVPLIAIALFVLFILNVFDNKFTIKLLVLLTLISTVCFIILRKIGGFSLMVTFLISYASIIAISSSIFLSIILKRISTYFLQRRIRRYHIGYLIKCVLIIIFVHIYGLMWIAIFLKFPFYFNWPIATVWYSPAIEWGFLGLLATLAFTKLGCKVASGDFGLKFVVSQFALQLVLLVLLNYVNYNYFYIITPYPFQPILFLPILALISSRFFLSKGSFTQKPRKILALLTIMFVILIFSLGSLGHILSASYWKVNNGWWINKPLNPSDEDFQLINFLYKHKTNSSFEFVGTFYDWSTPSSYVVYPSGVAVLSEPLIDILARTNESGEVYILANVFNINLILAPSNFSLPISSYISTMISKIPPIFENGKYKLYSISGFDLNATELPTSMGFITTSRIVFYGNLTIRDNYHGTVSFRKVKGEIYPIGDGKIKLIVNLSKNALFLDKPFIHIEGNLTLIDMKSTWTYFHELQCNAKRLVINGNVSFYVFNSFKERIYLEDFSYSGKYKAEPFPQYLRPDYAREQINSYFRTNNIDFFNVLTSPLGMIWTLILTFCFFIWYKKQTSTSVLGNY